MRLALIICTPALLLALNVGCDGDDGKATTGDTASTGGTNGTTSSDTDLPTGSGGVATCEDLCREAGDAGTAEGECASLELQSLGYDLLTAPYECAAIAGNPPGCNACMDTLQVSDADCVTVASQCL